ncbi:MAG TPA: type II toxin-antitoxin system Phd/YefM family antitoxin [Syntrophales bacterium]|nr:type II toxin-antitoxin system Phd/YefM family antitoxin [Syntrophales bacterium]
MRFMTVTELKQRATQIVSEIEATREPVVVTKNGKPVVLMRFVADEDFQLKEDVKGKEKGHGKDQGHLPKR